VGFSDTFPAGLVVAAVPNLMFSGSANCNPPSGANAGSTLLTFPTTILDAGASCTFSVNVTALMPGNLVNTTTAVTSEEGGNGAGATATLMVSRVPTATTIKVSSANPGFGRPVTFTATVKPSGPYGSGVNPTGTVSFFLNGSSTPIAVVPLSARGRASFSTTGLGAGRETVTAAYSGDANFMPSSSSTGATTTVTCTQTITGTHAALVLAHGSTCVLDATITGSIIVPSGAALDLENSTVHGAVSATSGTTGLRMCGSSASSVSVENSTGFAVIGDPADGCGTNVLNGSLTLIDNSGGVQAIGNFVAGAVTAINNTGAGPFPDDTAPHISGDGR
ncbi:MAG: Ig-like domain-containing protein, partial [Acidimicrobiales bacterium]